MLDLERYLILSIPTGRAEAVISATISFYPFLQTVAPRFGMMTQGKQMTAGSGDAFGDLLEIWRPHCGKEVERNCSPDQFLGQMACIRAEYPISTQWWQKHDALVQRLGNLGTKVLAGVTKKAIAWEEAAALAKSKGRQGTACPCRALRERLTSQPPSSATQED